LVVATAGCT